MEKFLREDLASLRYKPVKPLDVLSAEIGLPESELVKLDANENLWDLPPSVRAAMTECCMHIYPDPLQVLLRAELAKFHNVPIECIVAGAGSDDLLDVIIRMVETPNLVIAPPTFGMYSFLAKIAKVGVVEVPRNKDFDLDIEATISAIRSSKSRLCIFASPNNPTGNLLSNSDIELLCAEDCIVVMDEAYADFASTSCEAIVAKYPNLMILRTFSKWAGLAGLRVGYAIAHQILIDKMIAIKQPYNINSAADVAARAALRVRPEIEKIIANIVVERNRIFSGLSEFSFLAPVKSDANFVLCRAEGISASGIALALRTRGVLVRFFGQQGGNLESYFRVSAGRPQDTEKFFAELKYVTEILHSGCDLRDRVRSSEIDTVIFDMDGVLADVSRSYRAAIIQTAEKYGISISGDDVSAAKAKGNANDDWILSHRLISERKSENCPSLQEVTDTFEELYQGVNGLPGLEATESLLPSRVLLEAISEKYTCAIVTGRPRGDAEKFLQRNGIAKFFKHVVCMGDAPSKPDPAPVRLALEKIGKQRALMIGDTVDDIRAATAAGVLAVGVPPPGEKEEETAQNLVAAGAAYVLKPRLLQLAALL